MSKKIVEALGGCILHWMRKTHPTRKYNVPITHYWYDAMFITILYLMVSLAAVFIR